MSSALNFVNGKKATTLIELIAVVLVLAIIGVTVVGAIIFFVQIFMYSPRQMDAQKIGQELSNIIIDGRLIGNQGQALRGVRYARASQIIDATAQQFSYTYGYVSSPAPSPATGDQLSVRFRWNAADKKIYNSYSTDGGTTWLAPSTGLTGEDIIPYYLSSPANTISIDDSAQSGTGAVFTYKKSGDANWVSGTDPLSSIRRVTLGVNVKTASGDCPSNFTNFQGCANISSSCEVKPL